MKKFGHYEVTAELGRGGMGVVYAGFEPSLNRKVAIKCLGEHLLKDKDLVERFTREAKATAALNDPNVIQIYFIGEEQGQPYFAMEYIEGQSLDDILKGEVALSVKHAKNLLKQACLGLAAAHKKDLVHRDIKPANLMITTQGVLKVVDFGIARTREYGDKLTNTGEFVGTPGYLSPEVCIGKEVDARSDIFSLGIVFYEMLAGKVPFENDSPLGLMLEVVQSDIPDIRSLNNKVDKKTSFILNKMIAKSPQERYQSCEEIIKDLGNIIENEQLASIKKGMQTVKTSKSVKSDTNLAEKITLQSAQTVTAQNLTTLPKAKSSKKWLIVATLFAVIGAGAFGYVNGYLPFPKHDNTTSAVALVDANALNVQTHAPVIDESTQQQEPKQEQQSQATTSQEEKPGLISGIGKMFDNDTQKDERDETDETKIEFDNVVSNEQNIETNNLNDTENNIPQKENSTETIAAMVHASDNQTQVPAQNPTVSIAPDTIEATNTDQLLASVEQTTVQIAAIEKTKLPTLANESIESVAKPKIKKVHKHIPLNKGVVVLAFGDPAVANPIEKIIESELRAQGVKVMNEQFIPGMNRLLQNGLDLAQLKNLIAKNGGQAMIIANINHVGTQQLNYAGRSSQLINAQLDVDTYDIKTGDTIGSGFGSKLNYTSLNATDQATDAVMSFSDRLASSLKKSI